MLLSTLGKCKVCFFLSAELLCADLKKQNTACACLWDGLGYMTVCGLLSLGMCLSVERTGLHDCVWSVQSRRVSVCGTDWVTWVYVVCSV